jgi:hypothetical protein
VLRAGYVSVRRKGLCKGLGAVPTPDGRMFVWMGEMAACSPPSWE